MTEPLKCLFCDVPLGGREHVFLSALGGTLETREADCKGCNNDFARGDKIDDALAKTFEFVRCALGIDTGRGDPAPTLREAGQFADGSAYDLGPGLVPRARPAPPPRFSTAEPGDFIQTRVRNVDDLNYFLSIAQRCGKSPFVHDSAVIETKPLPTEFKIDFNDSKSARSLAKTAATGACFLFGNRLARSKLDPTLLKSIKTGATLIEDHAGWDYTNKWPEVVSVTPHGRTATELYAFAHSLMVLDVGTDWVGYIRLFGAFQFSIRLGSRSGLVPKSFALNTRKPGRFDLTVTVPECYRRRTGSLSLAEREFTFGALKKSIGLIRDAWELEAAKENDKHEREELAELLGYATDDISRNNIVTEWKKRRAHREGGGNWEMLRHHPVVDRVPARQMNCPRCGVAMTHLANWTWFCSKCGYQGRPLPPPAA